MIRVEACTDWRVWKPLRLEALADLPIGFGERLADAEATTDEEWEVRWQRPGLRVLAFLDDELAGMAGGFRDPEGRAILVAVYVRPAVRGRGVLESLVERVRAWADPDPLVLDVHVDNARAHAAYVRLGFVANGTVVTGGGIDGRDLIEMVHPA